MQKLQQFFTTKVLLIIAAIALVSIPVIFFATRQRASDQTADETPTRKKKVTKPVNEIPVEERPYVIMSPTNGREIDVTVKKVNKDASELEFLAEYQYGTSLGGNENAIDIAEGLPATGEFALYSRSAGGKTSYEEDVKGGTLTLKFATPNDYWLKQDWAYYDRVNPKSSTQESDLESRDGKFVIEPASQTGIRYVIIYNSPGYPDDLPGTALSDLYTFQFAGNTSAVTAKVTIETTEAGEGIIYAWDGDQWEELETDISGTTATAEGAIAEAYIVIGIKN